MASAEPSRRATLVPRAHAMSSALPRRGRRIRPHRRGPEQPRPIRPDRRPKIGPRQHRSVRATLTTSPYSVSPPAGAASHPFSPRQQVRAYSRARSPKACPTPSPSDWPPRFPLRWPANSAYGSQRLVCSAFTAATNLRWISTRTAGLSLRLTARKSGDSSSGKERSPTIQGALGDQLGGRFSMNACTPSSALGSIMLQAIVAPASA